MPPAPEPAGNASFATMLPTLPLRAAFVPTPPATDTPPVNRLSATLTASLPPPPAPPTPTAFAPFDSMSPVPWIVSAVIQIEPPEPPAALAPAPVAPFAVIEPLRTRSPPTTNFMAPPPAPPVLAALATAPRTEAGGHHVRTIHNAAGRVCRCAADSTRTAMAATTAPIGARCPAARPSSRRAQRAACLSEAIGIDLRRRVDHRLAGDDKLQCLARQRHNSRPVQQPQTRNIVGAGHLQLGVVEHEILVLICGIPQVRLRVIV